MEQVKASKETYLLMDRVLTAVNKNINVLIVGGGKHEYYHTVQSLLKHKEIEFHKININLTDPTVSLQSINKYEITLIEGFFDVTNHRGVFKKRDLDLLEDVLRNEFVSKVMFASNKDFENCQNILLGGIENSIFGRLFVIKM